MRERPARRSLHPADGPDNSRHPKHLHERIAERLNELDGDGPQAMRRLLDEFPEAGVLDWICAFAMSCSPLAGGPGLLVQLLREIFEMYPDLRVGELIERRLLRLTAPKGRESDG